jgi:enterochelin esterase-like enzyme
VVTVALLVMLATPSPAAGQSPRAQARPQGGVVREISFTSAALKNNLLGDPVDQKLAVYLPPGYDMSTERYPVVYLLHGIGDDYQTGRAPSARV